MGRTSSTLPTLVVLVALALGIAAGGSSFSSAAYVASSSNTSTVQAAQDWAPPTVTLTAPASSLSGTTTLTATASDDRSGVASVEIQVQPAAADGWTAVCTDTSAPYSCSWNTTAVADGPYDVRAVAVDRAGLRATTDPARTVVANNVLVVLANPGPVVHGTVPLTATVYNALLGLSLSTTFEYAATGTGKWTSFCNGLLVNPATCQWNTTALANGLYDLRARAVSTPTAYTSTIIEEVLVDNTAPTVTMTDPGSPLSGTITLAATATDGANESGVAQVVIQSATGSGSFRNACTITSAPYSCRFDTTTLLDGATSFRAVATDVAGNTSTSAVVTPRTVDNTVSSVSMEDPGAFLTGSATLRASASSSAGVTSVRIQRAPSGSTTWSDVCSVSTAPYTCVWNTTVVADGPYDLRAVLTDGTGKQTVSATVTGRRVDNAPLRGVDVQSTNGTGTAGRISNGDTMTFTYSRVVALGTVHSGWTGSALGVVARFRDGNVSGVGAGSKGDTLDIQVGGGTTLNLGSVNLKEDYVASNKTVTFAATLTASTSTVDGVERTTITLRLGAMASGKSNSLRTVSLPSTMVWSPSASARTPDGIACSVAPASETGTADREF
ncbi:signal peptidase I [Nocardioides sp. JQ2195]|uniref:Ig-like domain-containing protein n=1 Tax=Nocardioides sp. JQ2195 TaxID=2592334 RepID=UPI00143ECB60|nr:Ig-like domain-containing protein [Nocardioides sp. JQ2195]QIX28443.1 signal peptidase I [Nocardioides sp. JQ2195]